MKTVSAPIQIDAPPMTVWRVLTDLGRYQDLEPAHSRGLGGGRRRKADTPTKRPTGNGPHDDRQAEDRRR